MFQSDYRREMDRLAPSRPAMEKLEGLLAEGPAEGKRPRRRLGRRAALALALCGALTATALAAGPSVWEGLTHRLGDFAPYMTAAQGTAAEQGVEVALVGSISDGYVSKVYFTVTDRTGGRFNSHTAISARLDGALSGAAGSLGCQVLEFDQAAGRLLVEAGATGLSGDAPVTLEVSGIDPGFRRVQEARFRPPASGQALDTETTAEGDVVLKAGQTPQNSPDTADFSISSMGFDGQGRFHIRLTMAEGFTGDGLLAVPYDAGNEQMGSTLERIAVDGGMDCVVGGITPADAADMAYIRVYGTYRGPEAPIEGTWSLPVALEPAEARTLTLERELGNFRVGLVELSPLSVAVSYDRLHGEPGFLSSLQVTRKDGTQAALEMKMGSAGGADGLDAYSLWLFTQPVELDDIASITIRGETIPLS